MRASRGAVPGGAAAQSLSSLNAELSALSPRVSAAISGSDYAEAGEVVNSLDRAESDFARLAEGSRGDRGALLGTYEQLEEMLGRMHTAFKQKKDECIAQIERVQCDYDEPEQISLRALYPLSWLRYQGSFLYGSQSATAPSA